MLRLGPSQPGLPGGSRAKPARPVPTAWPVHWEPWILDSIGQATGLSQQDHYGGDNFQWWLADLPLSAQVSSGKEQPQTASHSQREGGGSGGVWRSGEEGTDCPWLRNHWSCVGLQEPDKRTGDSSVWATHAHTQWLCPSSSWHKMKPKEQTGCPVAMARHLKTITRLSMPTMC